MSFREIPQVAVKGELAAAIGDKGRFEWLSLDQLLIDGRYQREPSPRGERRIGKIAQAFDWRQCTPIVCAEIEGQPGRFAVIDGQHRCGGARTRGDIALVPAWIIAADVRAQATSFIAINANNGKVANHSLWHARHAAGDEEAAKLFALCARAGVEICRYPKSALTRGPHECLCPGEIDAARLRFGETAIVRALAVLVRAGEIAERNFLVRGAIRAAVSIARDNDWRLGNVEPLAAAFSGLKIETLQAKAAIAAAKGGGARIEHMVRLVREHLARFPAAA